MVLETIKEISYKAKLDKVASVQVTARGIAEELGVKDSWNTVEMYLEQLYKEGKVTKLPPEPALWFVDAEVSKIRITKAIVLKAMNDVERKGKLEAKAYVPDDKVIWETTAGGLALELGAKGTKADILNTATMVEYYLEQLCREGKIEGRDIKERLYRYKGIK